MSPVNKSAFIEFKHTDHNGVVLTSSMGSDTACTDVIRYFMYFLLGMSYSRETILQALETVCDEQVGYPASEPDNE